MRAAIAMLSHKVRSCDCRVEGGVGWCALMCWPFDSELHSMESLVKHLCMAVRVSWSGSDGFVYWRSGFVVDMYCAAVLQSVNGAVLAWI